MLSSTRSILIICATLAVALVLMVVQLPDWAVMYRPQLPLMVLAYWSMALPQRVGVFAGWSTGILMDVMTGTLLGQHALSYAVGCYVVQSQHRRLRIFPWWQQSVALSGIFLLDRMVAFLVAGVTTGQPLSWSHWVSPLVAIALWPWFFMLLRYIRQRFRVY